MAENEMTTETMEDYKEELEASFRKIKEGDILTGTVIAVSEDEVTLDLRYYAPGIIKATELSDDPDFSIVENIHVGDTLEASVISRGNRDGNIELSMREANDTLAWDKFKTYLAEETTLSVKVKESVPSGVIAYLDGIRAFIPASQLSVNYVEDTSSYIGRQLDVRVITADPQNEKLVLSAKVIAKEKEAEERNHRISMIVPGSVLEGTVESLMPYGAFVNLGNGLSGLIHISQICEKRIKKPSEVLKEGQAVKVKVLNTNDGKLSLSMRALEEEMVDTSAEERAALSDYTDKEYASTSLGDLLSKFKLN